MNEMHSYCTCHRSLAPSGSRSSTETSRDYSFLQLFVPPSRPHKVPLRFKFALLDKMRGEAQCLTGRLHCRHACGSASHLVPRTVQKSSTRARLSGSGCGATESAQICAFLSVPCLDMQLSQGSPSRWTVEQACISSEKGARMPRSEFG